MMGRSEPSSAVRYPEGLWNERNWLRTVPGKRYFVIFRLYSPTQAFFDQSWKPGDIEKVKSRDGR
jgi:hypothetical protein